MKATEWVFDRIKESFEVVAKKLSTVQEIMTTSTDSLAAHYRASRGARRRYDVILMPALQQCPVGRLRWVGLRGEKVFKLVVCDLWRKIRLEATKQALGGANRRKCEPSHGLQCACSTSGPMWEFNYCVGVAGEPTIGLIQNIVRNLGEASRKGLTEVLRNFIQVDNHRALTSRTPGRGPGVFQGTKADRR